MAKVYIVTEGCYSDYHIEACFSTKKEAQKYIDNAKQVEKFWEEPTIEEWELDGSTKIVDVINVFFTFTSPFSKRNYNEEITTRVDKSVECKAFEYSGETMLYGNDLQNLHIKRIANPNKNIEDEISKCIKIAYDTAKKIKYLYEVENVRTLEEMRERL